MLLRVLSCYQAEWSMLQARALEEGLKKSISQICSEPGDRAAAASHLCPRITLFTHTGWAPSLPSPKGQLIRETFPQGSPLGKVCVSLVILFYLWFASRHSPLTDNIQHSCYFLLCLITALILNGRGINLSLPSLQWAQQNGNKRAGQKLVSILNEPLKLVPYLLKRHVATINTTTSYNTEPFKKSRIQEALVLRYFKACD